VVAGLLPRKARDMPELSHPAATPPHNFEAANNRHHTRSAKRTPHAPPDYSPRPFVTLTLSENAGKVCIVSCLLALVILTGWLSAACDTAEKVSKGGEPPPDRSKQAAQVEAEATVKAPEAIRKDTAVIADATTQGRASVGELEAHVPGVKESPATPRIYRSFNMIEDARQRLDKQADALAALQPIAQEVRSGIAALNQFARDERAARTAAEKAASNWEKEAAEQKARADDAFKRKLEGWAALAIVGAVGCSIMAGVAAFKLQFKMAAGMACIAGFLVTAAVMLFVIGDYWKWIVGGVLITFAAFIGWLILSRIDRDKLRTTLEKIVPVIDKADPAGTGIKAEIAKAAAGAEHVVKATVQSVKRKLNPQPKATP
jgi:hypothetical protein